VTSKIKMLRREDVWHPRVGAPPGNRNRLKHGRFTGEVRALKKQVADWRRTTKGLMRRAEHELAVREAARQNARATPDSVGDA
jgi:hypothetical protein